MKDNDKDKTKKELVRELSLLRQRVAELTQREYELQTKADELAETAARYRTIIDGSFDWEFLLTPGAEFAYTSPSCERITGYTAAEFADDPALFYRIIHKGDMVRVAENLNRRRAENSSCEIEFRIVHRDGSLRRISLAFHSVYQKDGQFMGIRGSNREITAGI